jgi:mannose-6-phosphate isomerase-like protein (cupin superfamily)
LSENVKVEDEMKLAIAIAWTAFSIPAAAQPAGQAEVFSASQVHGQFTQLEQQAKSKGGSGATLGDYGTHAIKLSSRTTDGGAEIHAHFDDVMLVTEGKATLITGGAVVDPHTGSDGETHGKSILNGVKQEVSAGDIIHIPAGTPHQLLIAPGATYNALVIKIKE